MELKMNLKLAIKYVPGIINIEKTNVIERWMEWVNTRRVRGSDLHEVKNTLGELITYVTT